MGLLSNNDIYTADTNPTSDINPKTVGALWINYKTGTQFTCSDNTKDKNIWKSNWESIYPIGSLFITIENTDPNVVFGGKWRLEGGNRALWSVSSGAGGYISSGLPNITGETQLIVRGVNGIKTGCFKRSYEFGSKSEWNNKYPGSELIFNASDSNPIYGRSEIVQPPAFKVYIWIREA